MKENVWIQASQNNFSFVWKMFTLESLDNFPGLRNQFICYPDFSKNCKLRPCLQFSFVFRTEGKIFPTERTQWIYYICSWTFHSSEKLLVSAEYRVNNSHISKLMWISKLDLKTWENAVIFRICNLSIKFLSPWYQTLKESPIFSIDSVFQNGWC